MVQMFGCLSVLGNIFGKEFQCNASAKARVPGFVDHAHSSAAQFFQDAVVGDGAASNGGSIRHGPCSLPQPLNAGNRATWAALGPIDPVPDNRNRAVSSEVRFSQLTSSLQVDPRLRTLDPCALHAESVLIGGCPGTLL